MSALTQSLAPCVLGLALSACAFIPATYPRLLEARDSYDALVRDPEITRLAPRECAVAKQALADAETARNTLDDSAVVDHLSYVAKQRGAIAREAANAAKVSL
ncbi:MAG: DUF4398 domain-containing protein [Usitatibacter sp.]